MAISGRVSELMMQASWIRRMFEEGLRLKAKHGADNVFDFSLGNPIAEPPREFNEALVRLVTHPTPGMHRYMPNAGIPETRDRVSAMLSKHTGLTFGRDQIVMTCGAGGGLNVVLKTLLDAGDRVLIFSPYFVEYIFYVDTHGGVPVKVATTPTFDIDLDAFEKALNSWVKVVLINSPNNPTGVVYPEATLKKMGEIIQRKEKEFDKEIYLVSDEPYRRLVYDGVTVPWIFHAHPNSIVVTSFSKDLGLGGERIGFVAIGPDADPREKLFQGFTFANRVLGFINAPALMQHAIGECLESSVDMGEYRRKRELLCNPLREMGYEFAMPQGAFYLFPKSLVDDDVLFIRHLQQENILAVPGTGFGTPGYFRLSFSVEDRVIEHSIPHFQKVMKALRK
ncbi:MAG: pyridoxal phosphate-dependent aminotransferase [Planctomycetes bacterium]|nr:pyridoxal phosphate-dependent aminotransferase [Planctomycetota bacterium]MBI3844066.1 pyridoxal phosphate-dependent aminotransferase [Planctomycetota bacterium]